MNKDIVCRQGNLKLILVFPGESPYSDWGTALRAVMIRMVDQPGFWCTVMLILIITHPGAWAFVVLIASALGRRP